MFQIGWFTFETNRASSKPTYFNTSNFMSLLVEFIIVIGKTLRMNDSTEHDKYFILDCLGNYKMTFMHQKSYILQEKEKSFCVYFPAIPGLNIVVFLSQ